MSMDALPTLLSAAGGDPGRVEGLDGIDLMPFLRDVDSRTDRTLFWRHRAGDQIAVRSGQWKYLRSYGRDYPFDLSQDVRSEERSGGKVWVSKGRYRWSAVHIQITKTIIHLLYYSSKDTS